MRRATFLAMAGCFATLAIGFPGCGRGNGEHEYVARFTLPLPEEWERRENYRDMPLVGVAPVDEGEFPVNVNVRIIGNDARRDLDALYEAHFDSRVAARVHRHFELIDVAERTVGGRPARRIVYAHYIEPDNVRSLAYLIHAGETAYIVTFNAAAGQFAKNEADFDRIAARFEAD